METYLAIALSILIGFGLLYGLKREDDRGEANDENVDNPPDPDLPEWPVVYRNYDLGQIHTIKNQLEANGIDTILEEIHPGTWGDGVAIKHDLRTQPEKEDEAKQLIDQWETSESD